MGVFLPSLDVDPTGQLLMIIAVFFLGGNSPLPIDTLSCGYYIGVSSTERRVPMAKVTITFSDIDQQRIEGIIIDKDQDEALRYVVELLDKIKGHPGHACGPKAV
jgi:hypothetical protein